MLETRYDSTDGVVRPGRQKRTLCCWRIVREKGTPSGCSSEAGQDEIEIVAAYSGTEAIFCEKNDDDEDDAIYSKERQKAGARAKNEEESTAATYVQAEERNCDSEKEENDTAATSAEAKESANKEVEAKAEAKTLRAAEIFRYDP